MRAIFISYRRDDSEGEAGRLFDDLVKTFGEASVFMDVAAIQVGRDFRKAIDESVANCGVLLAVIGKNWLDARNEAGERRLDNPSDFVRLETAAALKRDIPVIPVLVHGARMPRADELPDGLKDLGYRNACELTHARWGSDLQLLINALRAYVEAPKRPSPTPVRKSKSPGIVFAIIVIAVVAIAFGAYKLLAPGPAASEQTAGSNLPGAPVKQHLPNFAGTWELFENTYNGVRQPITNPQRIVITQDGRTVSLDRRELKITPAGAITYQTFFTQDGKSGHAVANQGQADLVDTFTWRIEGATLVFETTFNYKAQYGNHPPGTEFRIMKYRRVTPP